MPSNLDDFYFDVNYAFGSDSVFTLIDREEIPPLPPIEGYFLLLAGPPFNLLNQSLVPPNLGLL